MADKMTKTKPKGFCWPPDLFDLYEAKAAQLRAENPKSRESVSSLQEKALYAYAVAQGWCVIEGDEPPQRERSLAQAIREWNELPPATKF